MLRPLQQLLGSIYDAHCGHDVRDFLLTQRDDLPASRRDAADDEELVLVTQGGEAWLGVYIDESVLDRLAGHDPLRELCTSNIADFWTALEGVSHFSYLMWNAGHDRGVSQLELELQAEVDKYVASWWLLRRQHPHHVPRELHHALFTRTRVNPALDCRRRHLYAAASHYASRFCSGLEASLGSTRPAMRRAALAALRRFYRLGSTRKLRHIESLADRLPVAIPV
jgi:hypothetical protein